LYINLMNAATNLDALMTDSLNAEVAFDAAFAKGDPCAVEQAKGAWLAVIALVDAAWEAMRLAEVEAA
jgi:hypothetical protein